jgi:tetratricopeptide (TPR) repeat protein
MLLWNRGRGDEAIPLLVKSDPNDVDARLTLARIYKAQGNQSQADMYVNPLIDYLKSNALGEIDNVWPRIILARAYMQLDDFQKSIEVLTNAYSMKKSDFYRAELSSCYLLWYGKLLTLPQTPDREQLKLDCIVKALEWDDRNVQALSEFVRYMSPSGPDSPQREDAHRVLTALRGNNAYLHLYLGHKLYGEGKVAEAEAEWTLAYKLNPNSPVIVNNFAWILTHGNGPRLQPDLIRAESLINQVITRTAPDDVNKPKYHGTRGTIYMKMARFQEARTELLLAAQHHQAKDDIPLQQQLMEVHDRLGLKTEAEVYRKIMLETVKRNTRVETEKAVQ